MDQRLLGVMVACGIWLLAWLAAPGIQPFEARLVAPETIEFYSGNTVGMPESEAVGRLQRQDKTRTGGPLRQLHFTLPANAGASIFLAAAPAETRLWVNGMVGGESEPQRYFGPGFGPERLSADFTAARLSFASNRIDLVNQAGWNSIPPIYVVPAPNGPAFTRLMEDAAARLRAGSPLAGGLGLGLSLIGLLLLRSRLLFAGGTVFSLALLDQGFGYAPQWVRLLAMTAGLGVILAQRGGRGALLIGSALAAAGAVVVGSFAAAGLASAMALIWGASAALWAVAALGLPAAVLAEGQAVWTDFIAARSRLSAQAGIIEQQQADLQASIRAQAVGEERQRFVRDMHDGVGGHLLSLLMRVRAQDADGQVVAEELEKGLTDLRLMADSLDTVGHDLDQALAAFQRRAGQQLAAAGLEFDWDKPESLSAFQMDARAVLNLYRIIQEALSNTVRHADASRFEVAFALAADRSALNVTITDDGRGFVPDPVQEGRGLANIRKRAEKLGGEIVFGPDEGGKGSRITLSIPAG